MKPDETAFEAEICGWLAERGGYGQVNVGNVSGDFDPVRGLDLVELSRFVESTQPEAWGRLVKLHGGDLDETRTRFTERLAKELDTRGAVDVLLHGVVHLGVTIRLAFFRPAHGLTP